MAEMSDTPKPRNSPNSGSRRPETPQRSIDRGETGEIGGATSGVRRAWSVGSRTVTLTIPRPNRGGPVFATAEWSPDEPSRLSTDEWRQYRQGRNGALTEIAAELGISVAVLDL